MAMTRRAVVSCAFALVFCVALVALAQQQIKAPQQPQQKQAANIDEWWNDTEIQKDLALTKEQVAKLDAAWKKFETNRNNIRAEYRQTRQDLNVAFGAEKIDAQKVNALAAKLADLEGKIIKSRLAYRLEVMQALSFSQRQKLNPAFKSKGVSMTPISPAGIVSGEVE